ncbi:TraB/GumN family protein [Erysipelothrix rhusiopathiae]|uniref:TraB/GumN family protein n=1 Tax=Erysipelothrix rhusiopathiae TaxID=1648 RepID=UPI0020926925|nr:TraB/GumN family protein [Erysipelothrix rhusiopathiae]
MKTIKFKDKTLHFVSTAHVSKQSVLDVQQAIETIKPQAVCIELDDNRARNLMESDKYKELDIKQIIKPNGLVPLSPPWFFLLIRKNLLTISIHPLDKR